MRCVRLRTLTLFAAFAAAGILAELAAAEDKPRETIAVGKAAGNRGVIAVEVLAYGTAVRYGLDFPPVGA